MGKSKRNVIIPNNRYCHGGPTTETLSGIPSSVERQASVPTQPKRTSQRLRNRHGLTVEIKKKVVGKKAPKVKNAKPAENGNKAEQPKAETTEAK